MSDAGAPMVWPMAREGPRLVGEGSHAKERAKPYPPTAGASHPPEHMLSGGSPLARG